MGEKIIFENIEFKTSRELMLWTENELQKLQSLFLDSRIIGDRLQEEKQVRKMLHYLELYTASLIKKKFRSYIINAKDLKRRAYLVAEDIILQYYQRPDFRINFSFGGYIEQKIIQILFSKKYDFGCCADYTKTKLVSLSIKNNKIYKFPNADFIFFNTCKVYGSAYNEERDIWKDYELMAIMDLDNFINNKKGIKYFKSVSKYIIQNSYMDSKQKLFMLDFDNIDNSKFKLKIEFKVRNTIKGMSLDKIVKVGNNKKVSLPFSNLLLGQSDVDISTINEKIYNVVDHIINGIELSEQVPYCENSKLNLHRYIALRNRILLGEEEADKFFKLVSNDAKNIYEGTLQFIEDTLRDQTLKNEGNRIL